MGMFDDLKCKYPLPVDGANELSFQTKDTPEQYLDLYEIREDGTLWHEEYEIEDRSDKNAGGLMAIAGMMTRVNKRWEQVNFTGEIRFYTTLGDEHTGWLEFSSYFEAGKLQRLNLIEHRLPDPKEEIARREEIESLLKSVE